MSPIVEARGVAKTYHDGDGSPVVVLAGLDFAVDPGEFVAIVGASGAGKSTLLHLLGGLDVPTAGIVALGGRDLAPMSPADLARVRNREIGFVFQFHHLLRDFTALENVMMPLLIAAVDEAAAADRASEVLAAFGLEARSAHYPSQLSGGERQRVAVARAVVRDPVVVLADEPSGNLDPANADTLHRVFGTLRERFKTAVVVATHNQDLASKADRVLRLERGALLPAVGVEEGQ